MGVLPGLRLLPHQDLRFNVTASVPICPTFHVVSQPCHSPLHLPGHAAWVAWCWTHCDHCSYTIKH